MLPVRGWVPAFRRHSHREVDQHLIDDLAQQIGWKHMNASSNGTVMPGNINEQLAEALASTTLRNDGASMLFRALFCDIARISPNFVLQDFTTLLDRRVKEGETFYLYTLPLLGKAVEVSYVTEGRLIVPDGWRLVKNTRLPKFLYSSFKLLFQDDGLPMPGVFLGKPSYFLGDRMEQGRLLALLRQTFMLFSKVHATCAPDIRKKTLEGFRARIEHPLDVKVSSDVLNEARRLIAHVVGADGPATPELKDFAKDPWGRHGPGAVAGRERGRDKWMFHVWPGLPSSLFDWGIGKSCGISGSEKSQPCARVVDVPKDFRGPRIICIEPKENQFAQQGLMDALYATITRNRLSGRSIDFWDISRQEEACKDLDLATIDLSNASDTLSLKLARLMFPRWFYKLVTRFRTRSVMIDGQCVKSRCLATMGNATCFPLETLMFWALSLGTLIVVKDSLHRGGQSLRLDTLVFGDDIIVPLWGAEAVCDTLESAGCVVNRGKTCLWTPIRESCGTWTWCGAQFPIARPHTLSVTDYRSWIQWRDLLQGLRGKLTPALETEMQEQLEAYLEPKVRFNRKLQRLEHLVPTFVQRGRHTELPAYAGLYAWHVGNDRTPILNGAWKRVKMGWQVLK